MSLGPSGISLRKAKAQGQRYFVSSMKVYIEGIILRIDKSRRPSALRLSLFVTRGIREPDLSN